MATENIYSGITKAARKYFRGQGVAGITQAPLAINNEAISAINAAGTALVSLIKADTSDNVRLGPGVDTIIKIFNRPTTDVMALEVKTEFTGTDTGHFAVQVTADAKAALTTGGGIGGVQGVARLASTFTMTGGSLIGSYGQVANNGTLNGSGIMMAAQYGLIEDGGTFTAVSHVAAGWFDSHLTKTISAGSSELLYLTNNGTTQLDSVFFVYPGNKITNLFTIDPTDAGLVSANTAGAMSAMTNWRTIACKIQGETHYLVAAKGVA